VRASVAHPPEAVFEFLSDLHNHWQLEPHFLELEDTHTDGARVRVRGPLGLSRVAHTRVVSAEPPTTLRGAARIGKRTQASVRWDIRPDAGGSVVTFAAQVDEASLLDRLILGLGGRWWMTRIIERAVQRLGTSISSA
jgi:carbon monoxide dehydrogenase subunit G